MRLKLYVSKRVLRVKPQIRPPTTQFHFAVVDLDKGGQYPANFVATLPAVKNFNNKRERIHTLSWLLGERSNDVAKVLLADALKTYHDADVRAEIQRRLSLLNGNHA